jgi:hypothetical protein
MPTQCPGVHKECMNRMAHGALSWTVVLWYNPGVIPRGRSRPRFPLAARPCPDWGPGSTVQGWGL